MRIFILIMLCAMTVKPQANFSYSITGAKLDFVATSPTGFVYEWNYGDSHIDTSFTDSTSHTYASGSYTVKMRVFDTTFLLLDSAENTLSIQATGIEEFVQVRQLSGDLYDLHGRFVGRYKEVIVPAGIYVLIGETTRKIFIPY